MSAGVYTFERIQAKKDARIEFDLHEGWINIDVVKTIEFNKGVSMAIVSDEGLASDILFRVMGQVVKLHNGGHYLGTYLAPFASVQLGEGSELTGALYGKKVDVKEQAQITGMLARDLFALIQVNPNLSSANLGLAKSASTYAGLPLFSAALLVGNGK